MIPQLDAADQDVLDGLVNKLIVTAPRNLLRHRYYDHKNVLKDLGISIPPSLRKVETVVGWPSKAVDVLARRVHLDGFYLTGSSSALADSGFLDVIEQNRTLAMAEQAVTSALIMSPAFVTVTAGDVTAGEPKVLINYSSALHSTGSWDTRRNCLSAGLSITGLDRTGRVSSLVLYLPNRVLICQRGTVSWDVRQVVHEIGVPMEPLVFRPELEHRPFGRSRITRAVMSITDRAVRTALRTEVSAEFYSAPQRYAMGAAPEAFMAGGQVPDPGDQSSVPPDERTTGPLPGWLAVLGRMLVLERDEDGNMPQVGQFPQQAMTPHIEQMRQLASEFSAETDLMPDAMGVIQDNPSSAEAQDNRKEELRLTAESCIATLGDAHNRVARMALSMLDSSPEAMALWSQCRSRWRDPATPSRASAADATMKLVSAGVLPATSEVTWDGLSLTEDQREILRSEQAKAQASSILDRLAPAGTSSVGGSGDDQG